MMWMTSIFTNWRLICAGLATFLMISLYGWGTYHSSRADKAEWALTEYKRLSDYAMKQEKINNEQANTVIRGAHARMVEQIKSSAWDEFKRRYPQKRTGNAACGIRADGLRLPTSGSGYTDDSAEVPDGTSGEHMAPDREFVEACARDAGRLNLWIERCTLSPNICKVEP